MVLGVFLDVCTAPCFFLTHVTFELAEGRSGDVVERSQARTLPRDSSGGAADYSPFGSNTFGETG